MSGTLFAVRQQRVDLPFNDDDALAVYAARTGFPVLRDRFGFLNAFSRWRLYEEALPFPSSGSTAKFADLMDERAAGIVARIRREERELYILLSGGVDSTAMTIAVLRAAAGDFRHLHVVFNASTEDEYPAFVTYLCGTGIDMLRCLPHEIEDVQQRLLETGYTLAGWGADQLFGSAVSQRWPLSMAPSASWAMERGIWDSEAARKEPPCGKARREQRTENRKQSARKRATGNLEGKE